MATNVYLDAAPGICVVPKRVQERLYPNGEFDQFAFDLDYKRARMLLRGVTTRFTPPMDNIPDDADYLCDLAQWVYFQTHPPIGVDRALEGIHAIMDARKREVIEPVAKVRSNARDVAHLPYEAFLEAIEVLSATHKGPTTPTAIDFRMAIKSDLIEHYTLRTRLEAAAHWGDFAITAPASTVTTAPEPSYSAMEMSAFPAE